MQKPMTVKEPKVAIVSKMSCRSASTRSNGFFEELVSKKTSPARTNSVLLPMV